MRIRIVDDNPEVLELASQKLEAAGHEVECVQSDLGWLLDERAWDGFDGAVIDLHFYGSPINGLDLLDTLRTTRPGIIRVAYSALGHVASGLPPELAHHVIAKEDLAGLLRAFGPGHG